MPTRRRHYPQDTTIYSTTGATNENYLINSQSSQHLQQQQNNNLVFPATGAAGTLPAQSAINIGDFSNEKFHNNNNSAALNKDTDLDDKYNKASRQWSLRSLSTRLQASSGLALRTYIKQPLSAAAAVVTGVHPLQAEDQLFQEGYHQSKLNINDNLQNNEIGEYDDDNTLEKEDIFIMAARDRTVEFSNAIRSLQSRNISRAVNIRDPRKAKQIQTYSDFMMVSKFVGKNIASTYAKLEKLTMLAKKKSLFDDRPQEIQELTYIIKGDLNALNQQIAKLQDISKDQRRSNNGKHLVSHSSNMVLALQSKLASMSTDFKQILEVRTENLKHQKTRREQFGQGGPPIAMNTMSPATAKHGSLLLSEENQMTPVNASISIDMTGNHSDTSPLIPISGGQSTQLQMQQQIALYDDSDSYVQQRAETMQNIESTIVELGGIFQQLAHMVKEQEEIVERIDTNVQDAELNIEAAHGEILKYFQSVSKNRWLMIKIFGVLIFFFIFFVVFLT